MGEIVKLRGAGFRAFPLTSDDGPALQRLLEECADYIELVYGRPPGPAEAQSVFYAGPEEGEEGYEPRNKMIFGIKASDDGKLIGVLDTFRDHPQEGVWYIGLLLLSPDTRGSGIGREVVDAFTDAARAQGATEIQLNVVEQNEGAHRFWSERGFTEVRRWHQHLGARESTLIRMRCRLKI